MTKTLDLITQELLRTNQEVSLRDGELDAQLEAELESIQKELATKTDHYAYRMERLDHAVSYWDQKVKDYQAVKKAVQLHLENMKSRVKDTMRALDTPEIRGEEYVFKIRPSSNPKVVLDKDDSEMPADYVVIQSVYKADLKKIAEDLKEGKEIEGAHLEYGTTLSMKPNKEV